MEYLQLKVCINVLSRELNTTVKTGLAPKIDALEQEFRKLVDSGVFSSEQQTYIEGRLDGYKKGKVEPLDLLTDFNNLIERKD